MSRRLLVGLCFEYGWLQRSFVLSFYYGSGRLSVWIDAYECIRRSSHQLNDNECEFCSLPLLIAWYNTDSKDASWIRRLHHRVFHKYRDKIVVVTV